MSLVDNHCHLDFDVFSDDVDGTIERARGAGVETILTIGTVLARFSGVRAIAEAHDNVFCTVGVHPHEADAHEGVSAADLKALADHPKVVGIGETGLDYHYEHSDRGHQKACFAVHLEAARETGLPVVVHARNADEDTAAILKDACAGGGLTGVMHCFTASYALAETAIELGFYVSFSGILTFKNAEDLRETARALPLDRLLVETDAPYLTPVPHRGRSNEPAFVAHTAACLAELRGIEAEALAAATSANFFRLFAKARPRAADAAA